MWRVSKVIVQQREGSGRKVSVGRVGGRGEVSESGWRE